MILRKELKFQQIYINGSEDISSQRSSQLAITNWLVSFLFFILFIVSVFYTYKLYSNKQLTIVTPVKYIPPQPPAPRNVKSFKVNNNVPLYRTSEVVVAKNNNNLSSANNINMPTGNTQQPISGNNNSGSLSKMITDLGSTTLKDIDA